MTDNPVVRARVEQTGKDEATGVLAARSLILSDAFRMLVKRIATEKALRFGPLVPNEETIEAMKDPERAR